MGENKNYVVDSSLTKAVMKGELSKYGYTLDRTSVESIVDFPVSKIYYTDVIRLFGLFEMNLKTFKAEIDTYKGVYTFNEKNYTSIDEIDKSEPVNAIFIAHYGESPCPRVFLMLTPFNASICINDKYGIPYGFYEDISRILSKNKRLLDLFSRMNIDYTVIFAFATMIIAAYLGSSQILLASMSIIYLLLISLLYAVIYYSKRSYYRIYLSETPYNNGPIQAINKKIMARMLGALQLVFK